jgi:hypothetical protein
MGDYLPHHLYFITTMNLKVLYFNCFDPRKIDCRYTRITDNDDTESTKLPIADGAHPDLLEMLNKLVPIAVQTMLWKDEWLKGDVISIALKHDKKGIGCSATVRLDEFRTCDTRFLKPDELDQGYMLELHIELVRCVRGKRKYQQEEIPLFGSEKSKEQGEPEQSPQPELDSKPDYSSMTVTQLRDLARGRIVRFKKMKQAELVAALTQADKEGY